MIQENRQQLIDDQRAMLDWLEANPKVFVRGGFNYKYVCGKSEFLSIAKSLGSYEKAFDVNGSIKLTRSFGTAKIVLEAPRETVCVKIQDAVWDCEQLLTKEEEAAI